MALLVEFKETQAIAATHLDSDMFEDADRSIC